MNGIKCHLSRDEVRKILSEAIVKRLGLARRFGAPKIIARNLGGTMAKRLPAGSEHYTAYVGPPGQFDFMGATQFRLLCTLGLRDHHRLLDFGCGSLRASRLFIPYLNPGHYYGVEPNQWLVEDAVKQEIGADIIQIKKPTFLHHDTFTCREFNVNFSYILAQSIFSHAGVDIIQLCLEEFSACLEPEGNSGCHLHPRRGGRRGFRRYGLGLPGLRQLFPGDHPESPSGCRFGRMRDTVVPPKAELVRPK